MSRLAPLALVLPALLAGCVTGTQNRGVESVHQPVVARNDFTFDLATQGAGLAPGESERLRGWLASLRVGYGDRVAVDDPAGIAPAARQQVGALVTGYGLFIEPQAPITAGEIAPGTVRVVVTRVTASVPGCPDYSRDSYWNFEQHAHSNYGCATNSNLAAMVARPEDLVRGQPGAPTSDPAMANRAIQALRKANPTGAGGTATAKGGN